MCGVDVEHLMHIFFDCPFAMNCWKASGIQFDVSRVEFAVDWLIDKLAKESQEVNVLIATTMWGIWYARNQKVWDQKSLTPTLATQRSMHHVSQWKEAQGHRYRINQHKPHLVQNLAIRWKTHVEGRLKLNVDASIFSGSASFKLGMVIRDSHGQFIKARNLRIGGAVDVMEAEVTGVVEAFHWLQELKLADVDIECESRLTINALQLGHQYFSEMDNALDECRNILKDRPDYAVVFVCSLNG